MDQRNFLQILKIIMVMTRDYLKCCNVSLLKYRRFGYVMIVCVVVWTSSSKFFLFVRQWSVVLCDPVIHIHGNEQVSQMSTSLSPYRQLLYYKLLTVSNGYI